MLGENHAYCPSVLPLLLTQVREKRFSKAHDLLLVLGRFFMHASWSSAVEMAAGAAGKGMPSVPPEFSPWDPNGKEDQFLQVVH